ncbi:hypothetical protein IFM89_034721 [Coptis chinensis]|uniref:Bet1-like SNARE 1-1 n=1 Tax=Coptis chinensis TaxID=261450 RepID=A0A835HAS2_9MAGN|nr:hypothetical protein IFM89_034721 [Coptis chinensis]
MQELREYRRNRNALFDGIEEGGIRATSYSHEIDEQDNDRALDGLQDRVILLKRVSILFMDLCYASQFTGDLLWLSCVPLKGQGSCILLSGDINEEVESHNRLLDRTGNEMDASRGILSGTMDRFKMVFETKSSRRVFTLVATFVVVFLVVYYLTK